MQKYRRDNSVQIVEALKDISFDVRKGEAVALLGHNGCGKSTLLKAIAGIIIADGASVELKGRVAPLIELGAGFDGELSGIENIYLSCTLMGLDKAEIDRCLDQIIEFSELKDFIELPLKNYSSGMYARLGFACATAIHPDVLLVDEVLAVGDSNFSRKCLARVHALQELGTTILLVSHDENAVRSFCERAIVLSKGQIQYDGPVAEGLHVHARIMDERHLNSLPEEERAEILRVRKLKAEESKGSQAPKPCVESQFLLLQHGATSSVLDVASGFKIEVTLKVQDAHLFEGEVSIGIGIHSEDGRRIGGCNNVQLKTPFPVKEFSDRPILVMASFDFPDGVPQLSAGVYKIYVGVHDQSISRSILIKNFGDIKFVNSRLGINEDRDLISLAHYIRSIEFRHRDVLDNTFTLMKNNAEKTDLAQNQAE
ncbi:MAG: ATP-binding cassette domain-containing protein [Deltaproteobacteria bacterium]|nr:ATP-binding cassette domain-containing protein [Deltaproteobacteria bacterium]